MTPPKKINYTEQEMKEIVYSSFINRSQFQVITGLKENKSNQLFNKVRAAIEEKLDDKAILPDSRHIPTNMTFEELKKLGIDRKTILARYKQ